MNDLWEQEEEYNWHWYYVSALDPISNMYVVRPWPICAAGFREAMNVFEVLWKMGVDK